MIDLHQGLTGEELKDTKPGLGGVAFAQLDAWTALARRDWRGAARKQVRAWALLARVVFESSKRVAIGTK